MIRSKKVISSLLVGVVLGFVITVGAFLVFPSDFNRAKNSVVKTVKNLDWDWTGFFETKVITITTEKDKQGQIQKTTTSEETQSGKTLWDWLKLAGTLAVPIVLFILGNQFQQRDRERAEEQAKDEEIQNYLNFIANLLSSDEGYRIEELIGNLGSQFEPYREHSVFHTARSLTRMLLRKLKDDKERQARIFYFLEDAGLYRFILRNANLEGVKLSEANLSHADLRIANLSYADLRIANLEQANLEEANLSHADLYGANLSYASLSNANLEGANLSGAELTSEQIKSACNWEQAIYKGKYIPQKQTWIAVEPNNTNFIEELKKDK